MKTYKLTLTITTDNDDLQKDYDTRNLITSIETDVLFSNEKIIEHKLEEVTTPDSHKEEE